jgi:LPPG:FO 2-phospho-L-lactate transferase
MLDVVDPGDLIVVANTGDDVEIYGAYVCPDPDLVTFWLTDRIDERGWGLAGDTFEVMAGLRELGVEVWFNLGDRDLAIGVERARAIAAGRRLTEAHAGITRALKLDVRVLPMSDDPVRTRVMANDQWQPFQEFMIKNGGEGPVQDVDFRGVRAARATPEVLDAVASARAIVLGPSNPVISIGPMLALDDLRAALVGSSAPVVAVSPIVRGEIVKGPTAAFLDWAGVPLTSTGIATLYGDAIDGLVADEPTDAVPMLETEVLMYGAQGRRRLAEQTLRFALGLG